MIRRPPRSTRTDTLFPYTTLFLRLFAAHQDERGGAIVEAGRVSGGDRALLLERGTQPGKGSHLDALADELVLLDEGVALAALDRHRCDRSEKGRVGKGCVSTCKSRWSQDH